MSSSVNDNYEFVRNGMVFKKTKVGQPEMKAPVSEEPAINMLNQELAELQRDTNGDICVYVTYAYKRPNLNLMKRTGPNPGMPFVLDAEHAQLLLRSMACVYAGVGADQKLMNEATEYVTKKRDAMAEVTHESQQ